MTENRKLKVFLCHSKDDKRKVRDLYRRLVSDGFDAWLDEEKLLPGQDWDLEIRKAVREADVVVVCLSNRSITRTGYVQKEIRFALDVADEQPEGKTFIIPARLEECEVPTRLSKWQWVNFFKKNGYQKLSKSLRLRARVLELQGQINLREEVRGLPFEPIMMVIPAGKFLMGSTADQARRAVKGAADNDQNWVQREQPQHNVKLSEYFIGKYPITNLQYQHFVRNGGRPPQGWDSDQYPDGKESHPVVNVSWADALAYCQWLSGKTNKPYRLPTEAEREKASRGVDGRIWPWGNDFDRKHVNTAEAGIGTTTPIGQFSPQGDSPYGCADMIGNVLEWCADWFNENEYQDRVKESVKDPSGPQAGSERVLRGGSFGMDQRSARCAARHRYDPHGRFDDFGFRVAYSSIES